MQGVKPLIDSVLAISVHNGLVKNENPLKTYVMKTEG